MTMTSDSSRSWSATGCAVLLLFLYCCPAAHSAAGTHGAFTIRNVRVFDGEKLIPANTVTVVDGRIAEVGTDLKPPPGGEVVDGTGDTLLPGLIDSHVHARNRDVLRMGLVMGATTELDMYMLWQESQRWKEEEAKGAFDIADFRTAGTCFTVVGGHGTEPTYPPIVPIQKADQAQAFVDERLAHGSDYIKVMYDNGPRFAAMPSDTLRAIVTAAHKRGKMVIVHVFSPQGILDVINSGADGLAHVPVVKLPEPEFTRALAAHHIFAITTLGFTDNFFGSRRLWTTLPKDPLLAPYLAPIWRLALERPGWDSPEHISYADNEAALRILRDAGVPLLAGTDASTSVPAGALLHAELQLMVNAGLRPVEVLRDTTSVPADVFDLKDRGRVAPGLRADLLLVRGDPTTDISKTRDIVAIWKQGVRVDREAFRKKKVVDQNAAWSFGRGWLPTASNSSIVHVDTADAGTGHPLRTMKLTGEVKPTQGFLFAGADYVPSWEYQGASGDISGKSGISFRARGDGATYTITLYNDKGRATTKYFVAGKDWADVTLPFTDFGSDGKHVAAVRIASAALGRFDLELADAQIGAHRWLGLQLDGDRITAVDSHSPGDKAGLKPGDVINSFNGKPVTSVKDLNGLLADTHVGDKIPIKVIHEGSGKELVVVVGAYQS